MQICDSFLYKMNGLVSAAAEAEEILKKARWSAPSFDLNDDLDSEVSLEHNVGSWSNDQTFLENFGRKRPMEHFNSQSLSPEKRERSSQSLSPVKKQTRFNIHDKLRELYDELSSDETLQANHQGLKINSYLLEKLLTRMNLNVLILNLYPGNKGYSISLKVNGDTQMLSPPSDGTASDNFHSEETLLETARWPYEEEELLSYIDNEELPIVLLDLLEAEYSSLFYSGCIIAQIRDYRQAYPSFVCDTHHVLLKPTTQSIISDVNAIARAGSWGREDRLLLESAMVLATAPPLCLEPRPAVGLLAARLHHQRHILATPDIRRQARRYSQVAVNRKRRLDQLTQHRGLGLLDMISKQRARATPATRHSLNAAPLPRASSKYPKKPSEVLRPVLAPRVESPPLAVPSDGAAAVSRLARAYDRPRPSQDCAPQLMEEYILETERASAPLASASQVLPAPPGVFHIKLSILQRPSNQEFLGELYVDRDHVEGERNGSACRFLLGTRAHASRYIQQFTEIFTEEGRKSVRIKHLIPGQSPRISFTAGMREMGHAAQQLALQARAQSHSANPATPITSAVPSGQPLPTVVGVVKTSPSPSLVPTAAATQHSLPLSLNQIPRLPQLTPVPLATPSPLAEPDVVLATGPANAQRRTISANLPLLQAQLQAGPTTVQQLQVNQQQQQQTANPIQTVTNQITQSGQIDRSPGGGLKPQSSPQGAGVQHIQLHQTNLNVNIKHPSNDPQQQLQSVQMTAQHNAQLQNAQHAANQLLAQQLTNPPQPINPHKLQQAIIHIQHPGQGQMLQTKVVPSPGQQSPQSMQAQAIVSQLQQGVALQSQQNVTLQGQQAVTLQSQQGSALQGQRVPNLQGQQGLTLHGQQSITLQGQQGVALRGAGQTVTLQRQQPIGLVNQQATNLNPQINQVQQKVQTPVKQRTTHPAISALVTSLMNSAHKFQQAAAANAAAKSKSNAANNSAGPGNNATILNLLNSAPAAMTNNAAAVAAENNSKKNVSPPTSALLERLMAPPPQSSSLQTTQPQITGIMSSLQNVQVQIPGLAQPISLSLNVSTAGGGPAGLLVSVPVSQPTPPSTQSLLSLPITHLMAGGMKSGTPLQLVQRPRVPPRQIQNKLPTTTTVPGTVQYITQQPAALAHQQRRRSTNPNEPTK